MAKKQKKTKGKRQRKRESISSEEPQKLGWWIRQSTLMQHGLCIGFLIVVSFAFFTPLHFGGKSLAQTDTIQFRSMAQAMNEYEMETGEKALWSPNAFGGMPGYMIATPLEVAQVDDIPRLLRFIVWPSSHFIFLLIGTYFLAFYLVKNKWAGVFAACAYGLTTYIPVFLMAGHNSKLVAMAFAPWLVWTFVHTLRRPGFMSSLLFAAMLAINLRAGHVQITYYIAFLLLIWWIVEGVTAIRGSRQKPFIMSTVWLAAGGILGILMVAQPYLSNFEYKAYTIRGAASGGAPGGMTWDYAMLWSQGLGELMTLAIADSYGGAETYWGSKPGTGGPHYFGGLVLLFSALAIFKNRKREVAVLSIAALCMILFSLGENFSLLNRFMFNYFPLFDSFRVPETWLSVVALIAALLSAYGMKFLFDQAKQQNVSSALKGLGLAVALMVGLLVMKDAFFAFERPNEAQFLAQQVAQQNNVSANAPEVTAAVQQYLDQVKGDRREKFQNDAIRTILFLIAAGGILFLYQRNRMPAILASIALVGLITIDLGGVGRRYFDPERLSDKRSVDEEIPQYDFDRYIVQQRDAAGGSGHFRVLSLFQGRSPVTNARPSYFYESLGGYHGAKLRLYQDYLEHLLFNPSTGLPSENALDLLNTKYVVAGGLLPGARQVFRDEATNQIVNERDVLPRAFFVGETEVISSSEATWDRIHSASFDPARTALLPEDYGVQTTQIDSNSVALATLQHHNPHEITWNVNTDAQRLLVVSEIYYPAGWKAYLDEEETAIHRVDYLLRGVSIPAGEHTLTMRFEPESYRMGYWLTLVSTLFVYGSIAILLGIVYLKRRQTQPIAVDESAIIDAES